MGNEVDFLPADKQKSFLQIDSISLDVHSANLAKGTQNNKLQYLKENINNQIYFLPSDKRQRYPVCSQVYPKFSKVCNVFTLSQKRT